MKHAEYFMLAWLVYTAKTAFFGEDRLSINLISEYAAYFIAGASLFLVRKEGFSILRTATILGAYSLCLHQALKQSEIFEPISKVAVSPVVVTIIITGFFIVMLLSAVRKMGVLGRKNWSTIGALTYPLYLIHQFVGYMIFNHFYSFTNIHVLFFGTILLMILMAYAINKLVEEPVSSRLYYLMRKTQPIRL